MRSIKKIIIHSSATRARTDIGLIEIRGWHINDNKWSDVGYQFILRRGKRDGEIEEGRPMRLAGAHTSGHNSDSIGICLVGGVAEDGRTPENNFTDKQWESLARLISDLQGDFPGLTVHGHRDFSATHCPSFNVAEWLKKNIVPVPDNMSLHYDPQEPYSEDDYLEMSSRISDLLVWVQGLFKRWSA